MSRPLRCFVPGLMALLLASAALGKPGEDMEAAKVVLDELEAWDTAAAAKAVEGLIQRYPEARAIKLLEARVRFEQGDYQEAVGLLDEVGAKGDEEYADLVRATLDETGKYESRESAHFILRYRPGKDAVLAPYALDALEKIYAALQQDLGYAPPPKVRVEVYDDAKALSRVSTLPLKAIKTSGTIAICKFDKLMITSPKALVRGYDWLDTLAHEYVHLVVSKKSRNTVPIWIHEGLAKFLESRWRGAPGQALSPSSAGLLAAALKENKLIPFERMHPSMALLPSQEDAALAFAEVFTAVEYLHQKGGNALLVKLIDELKGGQNYDAAVAKAVGVSFPKFQQEWMAYLGKREFPKETVALSVEHLKFKDDDARAQLAEKAKNKDEKAEREAARFGDFLEIADPEGRKLAHLGELLRLRNRPAAAAEEFAKSFARVGNRSPALSNRYAQALIKLGQFEEAEKLLTASLKPYPGYARTFQNLGEVYLARKRPAEAERAFLEVVGIDPFDPLPHSALAQIYQQRGDEARKEREVDALKILGGDKPQMASDQGIIVVRSHPFARVLLDGKETGRTTPTTLRVAPGSHVVRLVNDERGFARESTVEVGASEEKVVEVMLDEPAAPAPAP